jgi:hypothetical protein
MATYYRSDQWVTDALGNAISGANVYFCSQPANTSSVPPSPLIQLYADPNGVTSITNPVQTDGYGHAYAYMSPGIYTVVIYSPQIEQVTLLDQDINSGGVSIPVAVNQGGTGATTAAGARANLGAAGSGANVDITSLADLSTVGTTAVTITGNNSSQTAITVTDGIQNSSWTAGGQINCEGIGCSGPIICGGLQSSSTVTTNAIANATPGTPVSISQDGGGAIALEINGVGVSETSLLGFSDYATQTTVGAAGGASPLPGAPSIYLQMSVNGTVYLFPGWAMPA